MSVYTLMNSLYVVEDGFYFHLDHGAIRVRKDEELIATVPLANLDAINIYGTTNISSGLIAHCSQSGIRINWFGRGGKFLGGTSGPQQGNILLRLDQYRAYSDESVRVNIAKQFVAGKIVNSRNLLSRAKRDNEDLYSQEILHVIEKHDAILSKLKSETNVFAVRGLEGDAAKSFHSMWNILLKHNPDFTYDRRTRRPPLSNLNAVMSLTYTMLQQICSSALEGAGLDPQLGYLHTVRPGRPSLSLDLMEEMRISIANRFIISIINKKQISGKDFHQEDSGRVTLTKQGKKKYFDLWQKYKQQETPHSLLKANIPLGLLPSIQARVLARHLRGDLPHYIPHLLKV